MEILRTSDPRPQAKLKIRYHPELVLKRLQQYLLPLFLLSILLLVGSTNQWANAQVEGKLRIHGSIKEERSKLQGAEILVYVGGKLVDRVPADNGDFEVILDYEHDYTVVVSKKGYAEKKLKFDTRNVPSDRGAFGFEFKFSVSLFKKIPGFDISVLDKPIGFVTYNEDAKQFTHDATYTAEIQERLAELLNELENARAELEDNYITSIEDGDRALKEEDYFNARIQYEAALKLKPGEKYPTSQIEKITKLEANSEETQKKYDEFIAKADGLLSSESYPEAIAAYREAQAVKPKEKYPKEKISEIDKKIAELKKQQDALAKAEAEEKAKEAKFNQLVADANTAFSSKNYTVARKNYEEALSIKPDAPEPTKQLKAIGVLESDAKALAEKDKNYQDAILKADKAFKSKDWETARTAYNAALAVKGSESYPKDQLAAIDTQIANAENAAANAEYQAIITKADKAFKAKDWEAARSEYNNALAKRPAENYPTTQLAAIDTEIANAEKAAADAEYQAIIAKADKAFGVKDWDAARSEYNNALAKRPGESHPTNQLAAIELQLADAEKAAADAAYQTIVDQADKAFKTQDWDAARSGYNKALAQRPGESYPTSQLAAIDTEIANTEKAAADAEYQAIIDKADKAFNSKSWETARSEYNNALAKRPGESYPTNQLAAIDTKLGDAEKAAADAEYQAVIDRADKAFKAKEWDGARSAYENALSKRPEESYPSDQLKAIETAIADESKAKANEFYDGLIANGDKAFRDKDWDAARNAYRDALGMRPNEAHPTNQLKEIDNIIASDAQAKRDAEYQDFIATADKAFKDESFDAAKSAYNNALQVKPEEGYPNDQIAEIDRIILSRQSAAEANAAKEKKYQDLIDKADKEFDSEEYESAQKSYRAALAVKGEEKYPQKRIDEIEDRLAELAAKNAADAASAAEAKRIQEQYDAVIATADGQFDSDQLDLARKSYQDALKIKEKAGYPLERIREIDALVAQRASSEEAAKLAAEKEAAYNKFIQLADKAFDDNKWAEARQQYTAARDAKPTESYPPKRLAEIEAIQADKEKAEQEAAELARQKTRYAELIADADKAFENNKYSSARDLYTQAQNTLPKETYPGEQLTKIESLLASAAEKEAAEKAARDKEAEFDRLVAQADQDFNSENYAASKSGFEAALAVKANAPYPPQKIAEIDRILKEQADKEEAEKAAKAALLKKEADYKALISKADGLLESEDFENAKTTYRQALDLKPRETYPQQKIQEISKRQLAKQREEEANRIAAEREQALKEKYDKLITAADASFDKKDYGSAKRDYLAASKVKPDEKYPQTRLSEIGELIAAMSNGGQDTGGEDGEKEDEFVDELAQKYPQGVTEEITKEATKTITTRIVVKGNQGDEYRKVVHNWGGKFFFKNGEPISEFIYNTETVK